MPIKFTPLGEHPDKPAIRKPFLMFISAVGFMIFFALYISTSTTVPTSSIEYELINVSKVHQLKPTGNDERFSTLAAVAAVNSNFSTEQPVDSELYTDDFESGADSSTTAFLSFENFQTERKVPEISDLLNVYDNYVIYGNKCRIRSYDYRDATISKKYFSTKPKMCPKTSKPFVFYAQLNVTAGRFCVGVNSSVLDRWYKGDVPLSRWHCSYKEAVRNLKYQVIDRHYDFGEKKLLKAGDCLNEELVWIECKLPATNGTYQQPLMLPQVRPVTFPIRPNNVGKKQLHVLVVGLDSVSRLNAHRQFKHTMKFLKSKRNLVELFGYNKIGLNSAPNQIPLLTGVRYAFPGMETRVKSKYFDNVTRFIWDDFEQRGYRTMFYEEQWIYGLFVYPSLYGFKKVPTTYWPRPIMQAIDKSTLKAAGNGWCIGPDFPAKHYLDYTYNTLKLLGEDRPLFSYSWLSETAHDQVNGGNRVDGYFFDFFTKLENDAILNNTAVFFISDHGFRFGDFRKTALGTYEDMLPYGFVLLPDWYYEQNPNALENLRQNSRRLVTVYDLHATLAELSDPWTESRTTRTANGFSLLSNVIPNDRSCRDADINFQFCSCFEPQPHDRSGHLAKSLSNFILSTMNAVLVKNNATSKCHTWTLDSIDDFARLSEGSQWTNFYKLTIKTKPTAQFEAAAEYFDTNKTWQLLSELDRTDWFSSHAACVAKSSFERYCYCRQ